MKEDIRDKDIATFFRSIGPSKLASIDETETETEETFELDITDCPKSPDSLKRWKNYPRPTDSLFEPIQEEPFQSATTLIGSDISVPPTEEFFASFKSKIAYFLGKRSEKKKVNEIIKPKYNEPFPNKQTDKKFNESNKRLNEASQMNKKSNESSIRNTQVKPDNRNKSPSLLKKIGKLGSKLHLMKPFMVDEINSRQQKALSVDFKSVALDPVLSESETELRFIEKSKRAFEAGYEVLRELGAGGHSTVFLGKNISSHEYVVLKFIKDSSVWKWFKDSDNGIDIPYEIHVMQTMNKSPLPKSIDYKEHFLLGSGNFVIVMEYLGEDWCDLYDYIENFGPVQETHAKEIFFQVIESIEYMHWLGYVHNDIKDENIMINMKTREIKLIDFGSCTTLIPGKKANLFYGTKKFAAPEAIQEEFYDPSAQEVWALGALLYVILFKMDPFKTDEDILETNLYHKIARLRSGEYPGINVSDEAVNAMLRMMDRNQTNRISISQIKKLPFLLASM